MTHPDALACLLLALGVFRLTRLVGWDDLTITLRHKVTGMGDREHHEWASYIDAQRQLGNDPWQPTRDVAPPPVTARRFYLSKMIRCPWCVGFWLSLLIWAAWLLAGAWTVGLAVPWALSAAVGIVAKNLDA